MKRKELLEIFLDSIQGKIEELKYNPSLDYDIIFSRLERSRLGSSNFPVSAGSSYEFSGFSKKGSPYRLKFKIVEFVNNENSEGE